MDKAVFPADETDAASTLIKPTIGEIGKANLIKNKEGLMSQAD